jgi:hypothetical protein
MDYKTKTYHQQKAKEHYHANRDEYLKRNQEQKARTRNILNEAKASGCMLCSEADLCCLDFHHLGDKDMTVSTMLGMNDARVRAEIDKCVILCRNCHAKVHAGRLHLPPST